MFPLTHPAGISDAAHVVQLALTPIFLLSGVAALLNVFTTRLGRIADQVDKLQATGKADPLELSRLTLRSHALDVAVIFAAIAGALTCSAALILFLGALRSASAGNLLFILFGGALCCAIVALGGFTFEMLIAGRTLRRHVASESAEETLH